MLAPILVLLAAATSLLSNAGLSSQGASRVFLTNAHVLSADGSEWLEGHAVLVEGARILRVAPRAELELAPGDAAVDLHGLYLIPGLIDLHAHLLLHPYDETSWEEQVLKESLELRTVRAVRQARATLASGFTTIRELGTEGAGYADVALRDAIEQGIVAGPRIFAATRAIVAVGGYGPFGFDPRFEVPKGGQPASGVEDVRRVTREQIAAGADWIKVYADYRRRAGAPSTPTFSYEELKTIVAEARLAGVPVAAHASTDLGIRMAVEAGVQTIEHGTGATRETLAMMRDAGVVWCPTLGAYDAIARYRGWQPGQPEPERLMQGRRTFAAALELGVTIACGSDVGVFPHGESWRELELLAGWGMKPPAVLAAATSVAADTLGRPDLGRIRPGALADLVALSADPLADPGSYRRVAWVMKDGQVAADRRFEPAADERAAVLAVCQGMLSDYGAGDTAASRAAFATGAIVALSNEGTGEKNVFPVERFFELNPPSPESDFHEWFSEKPAVRIDGDLATVWTPYVISAGGGHASGVDVFQLLRIDGEWRILSISYTNRPL